MREWESFTNQKQWESYLKNLLRTNDKALFAATLKIYELQTEEEKNKAKSIEENGVGFAKIDAEELTTIAIKIKHKIPISQHEYCVLKAKMPKYWKQLMRISKKKMEEEKHREDVLKEIEIEKEKEERKRIFREDLEAIQKCQEDGIPCGYGICDECFMRQRSLLL